MKVIIKILQFGVAIFATEQFVSFLLFLLVPLLMDIDLMIESNISLIASNLLAIINLVACTWVAVSMVYTKLLKNKLASNLIVLIAGALSLSHLLALYTGTTIDQIWSEMEFSSIKIIVLSIFYLTLLNIPNKRVR